MSLTFTLKKTHMQTGSVFSAPPKTDSIYRWAILQVQNRRVETGVEMRLDILTHQHFRRSSIATQTKKHIRLLVTSLQLFLTENDKTKYFACSAWAALPASTPLAALWRAPNLDSLHLMIDSLSPSALLYVNKTLYQNRSEVNVKMVAQLILKTLRRTLCKLFWICSV